MIRLLLNDERGAITVDWITLTAGILLLGTMIVYTVMNDSAGYLMDQFEEMNERYGANAIDLSALGDQPCALDDSVQPDSPPCNVGISSAEKP